MPYREIDKIRFIGFPIPTTPANLIPIGDPNGPGSVVGSYIGHADRQTDLDNRVAIMKHAVDVARAALPGNEDGVLNLFVAPEFYFHGLWGPYIYPRPEEDPVVTLGNQLAATFGPADYPNWTFLFGSAITTMVRDIEAVYRAAPTTTRNAVVKTLAEQWLASYGPLNDVILDMLVNFIKNCHGYPCCVVRNRNIIVSNLGIESFGSNPATNLMTTEKYYVSNEDFVLFEPSGKPVVTEQMTAYKPIDISAGNAKQSDFDDHAIFRQPSIVTPDGRPMSFGIEICLDHSDTRLRRNIDNEPEAVGGIHIQAIPSCGMQIVAASVAADSNGFVFNCDGQYALNDKPRGKGVLDSVDCLYANYFGKRDRAQSSEELPRYAGHTQLARVEKPAIGGDPASPDSKNATFHDLDPGAITVLPISNPLPQTSAYFAGGVGEIHIYGLDTPFEIYPSC